MNYICSGDSCDTVSSTENIKNNSDKSQLTHISNYIIINYDKTIDILDYHFIDTSKKLDKENVVFINLLHPSSLSRPSSPSSLSRPSSPSSLSRPSSSSSLSSPSSPSSLSSSTSLFELDCKNKSTNITIVATMPTGSVDKFKTDQNTFEIQYNNIPLDLLDPIDSLCPMGMTDPIIDEINLQYSDCLNKEILSKQLDKSPIYIKNKKKNIIATLYKKVNKKKDNCDHGTRKYSYFWPIVCAMSLFAIGTGKIIFNLESKRH
jgi:hypothetical protein